MAFDWRQLSADLKQRYEGTYVWVTFPKSKEESLFRVDQITAAVKEPVLTMSNKEHGTISVNYDTSCELSFRFPDVGYSWFDGTIALYFRRLSARRWKRGVCGDNSQFATPYSDFYPLRAHVNEATLLTAFKPKFPSWEQALKVLSSGTVLSVPVSNRIALGLSPTSQITGNIMWFDMKPIAVVSDRDKIVLKESCFQQEVLDYLKRNSVNAQVV